MVLGWSSSRANAIFCQQLLWLTGGAPAIRNSLNSFTGGTYVPNPSSDSLLDAKA